LDVAIARAVQDVGLTPLAAIEAATAVPAQVLGVEDRFGRLEPGYVADAVLFDGDWQVRGVWTDGRSDKPEHPLPPLPASPRRHGQIA